MNKVKHTLIDKAFQILSDFHLDHRNNIPDIIKTAPNLILAGDIGFLTNDLFLKFLDYVNSTWENTYYVLGNHEFHSNKYDKNKLEFEYTNLLSKYKNIHLLNRSSMCIDNDIEIFGCTLWSQPTLIDSVNDFKKIHIYDSYRKRVVLKDEFHNFCKIDKEWLKDALNVSNAKKKIVITHFLPLLNRTIPDNPYPPSEYDLYYSNDLTELFNLSNVWISGHTHFSFDFYLNENRWICNAYGYKGEKNNYNKDLILYI